MTSGLDTQIIDEQKNRRVCAVSGQVTSKCVKNTEQSVKQSTLFTNYQPSQVNPPRNTFIINFILLNIKLQNPDTDINITRLDHGH